MTSDIYERIVLNITEFDAEDVITTSGEEPVVTPPTFIPGQDETPGGTGAAPSGVTTPYGF